MEEAIPRLVEWATSQGVVMNGITPKSLPGRGVGIVATQDIEPGQLILTVPAALLRTVSNTPKRITLPLRGASTHGILAASLCLDTSPSFQIWAAVFPTPEDLRRSLPICWPARLRKLLPQGAAKVLDSQRAKFQRDWTAVSSAFPKVTKETYLYSWLLVNTRTFYHNTAGMALQPVADLFNHVSEHPCEGVCGPKAFTFTAGKAYASGEEIFIRYGRHANDTLLVEYGFVLPSNPWDETTLDKHLCEKLNAAQRSVLEEEGFWGGYMLDETTVCYRTQLALRMVVLDEGRWRDVLHGFRDLDVDEERARGVLRDALTRFGEDAEHVIDELADEDDASTGLLVERWRGVQALILSGLRRLAS